jgi:hypothetical protein
MGGRRAVTAAPSGRRIGVTDDSASTGDTGGGEGAPPEVTAEAATRLLEKLRTFVSSELDPDEQALLAVLLAPGVAMAYPDDEVVGFSVDWRANALPEKLATVLREGGLRVEGL